MSDTNSPYAMTNAMKTIYRLLFLVSLLITVTAKTQVIKHSYRFYNNFSSSSIECGPDLVPVAAAGSCSPAATPGSFITDNLPQCGMTRTVYHTNMHWGLRYPNTDNTITNTYTIHLYVKNTDFGERSWARIIDFSNGANDEGIYYKSTGGSDDRCLDFYPNGIVGACPYFKLSTYYLLTFTRNGETGIIDVYVNNTKFVSYNDAAGRYKGKPGTPIYIYRDDRSVACESGEANMAFLSFTNQYSDQSVVNAVYNDICTIANKDNAVDFSISPNPVCGSNQDVTVRYTGDLTAPADGYTFTWDWDGGTVKSGSGMGPYTVNWATPGTKNIQLTVKSTACDGVANSSTKTHSLEVISGATTTIHKTICQGERFEGYSTTGTYVDHFTSAAGCDSTRTLHLTVSSKVTTTINKTICQGQSFEGYNTNGTYVDSYTSASGCDSIRTLNLTVIPKVTTTVNETICNGDRFTLPSGREVGAGVYRETLQSSSGCDSVVTFTIQDKPLQRITLSAAFCAGTTYRLPSGKLVNTAGSYQDTMRYTSDCDSVIATVNLSLYTLTRANISAPICEGATYRLPSGRTIGSAGVYSDTLRNSAGCDSVITTLALEVQEVRRDEVQHAMCQGNIFRLPSGRVLSESGTYRDTLRNQWGCDSVITTLRLRVTPRSAFGVTPASTQICAGERVQLQAYGGESYRWLPTAGISDLTAAVQHLQPATTTTYQVVITSEVCDQLDTVAALVVVNPLPTVRVTKSNEVNCTLGIAQFEASGGATYQWSPTTGLSATQGARVTAAPSETTIYRVKAISTAGCMAEATVQVEVSAGLVQYHLPNAFSPNGDGLNDCFGVRTWGNVKDLQFKVYNRWGTLIFQTSDASRCWDGTYKGQKLKSDVYVYQVAATTNCGPVNRKGTVTLIR